VDTTAKSTPAGLTGKQEHSAAFFKQLKQAPVVTTRANEEVKAFADSLILEQDEEVHLQQPLTQEPKLTKTQEKKAKAAKEEQEIQKELNEIKATKELETKAKAERESKAAGSLVLFGPGEKK
jgi:uncharacterized protein YlxW (UPF0749 family)